MWQSPATVPDLQGAADGLWDPGGAGRDSGGPHILPVCFVSIIRSSDVNDRMLDISYLTCLFRKYSLIRPWYLDKLTFNLILIITSPLNIPFIKCLKVRLGWNLSPSLFNSLKARSFSWSQYNEYLFSITFMIGLCLLVNFFYRTALSFGYVHQFFFGFRYFVSPAFLMDFLTSRFAAISR